MNKKILFFDSTLRDGAQAEEISYSVDDKWKIVEILDAFGMDYIEAGNPGSNPKDLEFFNLIKGKKLKHARLTAFGSTRRKNCKPGDDPQVLSMLEAHTPTVAVFGKSWDMHVERVIRTTREENLNMIRETIAFLKKEGREVVFDAEHFYDGYKADPDYALQCLAAAAEGKADSLVLCDTNGGSCPTDIFDVTQKVRSSFSLPLGIHCHNDGGMAVANSIMAVKAGATQVQGTFLGFGERCGNANLSTLIANLSLKYDADFAGRKHLSRLTEIARTIAEISNIPLDNRLPYVGKSAFAHKGGMHVDGVVKVESSFEHIKPEAIGNERRILMSEVSGRSTVLKKIQKLYPHLKKDSPEAQSTIDSLKKLEYEGFQFEAAESSFELTLRKQMGKYKPFFQLEKFTILDKNGSADGEPGSFAVLKVNVDGKSQLTAAEGDGPVHAMDKALRNSLEVFYPQLKDVRLTDFKVRVIDPKKATGARVRVLIETTDGKDIWTTVGVSKDVIKASWMALVDSIEYKLLKDIEKNYQAFS